jgi:CSLREA domain-containing protein
MKVRWLFALAACAFLLGAAGAEALTLNVNSPADVPDVNPGDGVCETAPGNGVCTLRGAIQEANALPGADTIILQANLTYTLTRVGVDSTGLNGDLDINDSVTIVGGGAGSTIIDGNGDVTGDRVLKIPPCINHGTSPGATPRPCTVTDPNDANVTRVNISGVTIQHGKTSNLGGGMINNGSLTLNNVAITNNRVSGLNDWGGGIFNSGPLTIMNSEISNNVSGSANPYGGGIYNQGTMNVVNSTISGNTTGGKGGGIFNVGLTATVKNTTISGNTAASGGGIYKIGSLLVVINSTISGNYSTGNGGGIYASAGTTSLFNVTVTRNRSNSDNIGFGMGGGIANAAGSTFNFVNSIIALNENVIPTLPLPTLDNDDCSGTITSQGNNVMYSINSSYCTVNGAKTIADPSLGDLADNGGPTQTHALLPGSPAIDGGNSGGCTDNLGAILTNDQRGLHRPEGAGCDVGSFEVQTPFTTLANISTRLLVETGDNVLIGGFIITGTQPKKVIVRGIGPSLSLTGTLADPILELHGPGAFATITNDNWRSDQEAAIIATGIPPTNDLESAIVANLPAKNSAYTAIVRGANNGTGIGLVEAYDLDRTVDSKLANISTRGLVQTGNNVLIAGTIVLGQASQRVLIRAIGPSLNLAGELADPTLELRDQNGGVIRSNDNWRSDQEAEVIATGIPPANDLESAIVAMLPAGGASYTAIVSGVNGTTGVAIVEVYAIN